jgi:hypothetical protein
MSRAWTLSGGIDGGFRLVNVVPAGTEYLPHLKQLEIRVGKIIRGWPNQPGREVYSSMIPLFEAILAPS